MATWEFCKEIVDESEGYVEEKPTYELAYQTTADSLCVLRDNKAVAYFGFYAARWLLKAMVEFGVRYECNGPDDFIKKYVDPLRKLTK